MPCILIEKQHQLVARIITPSDIKVLPPKLKVEQTISGNVSKITQVGITVCTREFQFVFIHKNYLRKNYHLGEEVTCKVIHINEHGEYYASTIERKEYSRLSDSDTIYNYLKHMGGIIPLGNASSPEDINNSEAVINISFK